MFKVHPLCFFGLFMAICSGSFITWHFLPVPNYPANMLPAVLLCIWFLIYGLWMLFRQKKSSLAVTNDIQYATLCLALWVLFGAIWVPIPYLGVSWEVAGSLLLCVMLGAVVSARSDTPYLLKTVAWSLLIASCAQASLGWLQAMNLNQYIPQWIFWDPQATIQAVHGNIAQRNIFAHFVMWGVVAGTWLAASSSSKKSQILLLLIVLLMLFPLTWSAGRLVLAYALLWGILLWVWRIRFPDHLWLKQFSVLSSCIIIAIAILQIWTQEIVTFLQWLHLPLQDQISGSDRLLQAGFGARRYTEWNKAWHAFLANPWTGWGWGGYVEQGVLRELTGSHIRVVEPDVFTHSHSTPLQLLAETGWVGFGLACIAVGSAVWACVKKTTAPERGILLLMLIGISTIHSMFEFPLWYTYMLFPFALFLNLAPAPKRILPVRSILMKVIGIVFSCTVLWQAYIGFQAYRFLINQFGTTPYTSLGQHLEWTLGLQEWIRHPLWDSEAERAWAARTPVNEHSEERNTIREILSRQIKFYPQALVLYKIAALNILENQSEQALWHIKLLAASYPDQVKGAYNSLLSLEKYSAAQASLDFLKRASQHKEYEDIVQEALPHGQRVDGATIS